jgi:hypothetical protein
MPGAEGPTKPSYATAAVAPPAPAMAWGEPDAPIVRERRVRQIDIPNPGMSFLSQTTREQLLSRCLRAAARELRAVRGAPVRLDGRGLRREGQAPDGARAARQLLGPRQRRPDLPARHLPRVP